MNVDKEARERTLLIQIEDKVRRYHTSKMPPPDNYYKLEKLVGMILQDRAFEVNGREVEIPKVKGQKFVEMFFNRNLTMTAYVDLYVPVDFIEHGIEHGVMAPEQYEMYDTVPAEMPGELIPPTPARDDRSTSSGPSVVLFDGKR